MNQQAALGTYVFSLGNKTAFDKWVRQSSGGWVSIDITNGKPISHNTGQGLESISITGKVHGVPGMDALDKLRALQATRKPQTLITGQGRNLGRWKINNITETQSRIIDDGTALVVEFSVELEEFADEISSKQSR
jgi:hypothetical protein